LEVGTGLEGEKREGRERGRREGRERARARESESEKESLSFIGKGLLMVSWPALFLDHCTATVVAHAVHEHLD
jgi:hypothetical protein